MKLKQKREYYSLTDAAELLDCTPSYLLHCGATGKLQIAVFLSLSGIRIASYADNPDGSNVTCGYNGRYYVSISDLELLESGKKEIYLSEFYPIREHLRIAEEIICPDGETVMVDVPYYALSPEQDELKVDISKLFILYDDLVAFQAPSSVTEQKQENPKSIISLQKMVITMAKSKYRYDPSKGKSNVPTQIVEDAEIFGISIDHDTVRKWLNESANLLDQNMFDSKEE